MCLVKSLFGKEAALCKLSSSPAVLEEDCPAFFVNVADVHSVLLPFQRHHTHSPHCLCTIPANTKKVVLFMSSLAGWTIINFAQFIWNTVKIHIFILLVILDDCFSHLTHRTGCIEAFLKCHRKYNTIQHISTHIYIYIFFFKVSQTLNKYILKIQNVFRPLHFLGNKYVSL